MIPTARSLYQREPANHKERMTVARYRTQLMVEEWEEQKKQAKLRRYERSFAGALSSILPRATWSSVFTDVLGSFAAAMVRYRGARAVETEVAEVVEDALGSSENGGSEPESDK